MEVAGLACSFIWHLTRLVTKDMAYKADKASQRMKETNHVFAISYVASH